MKDLFLDERGRPSLSKLMCWISTFLVAAVTTASCLTGWNPAWEHVSLILGLAAMSLLYRINSQRITKISIGADGVVAEMTPEEPPVDQAPGEVEL